MVYEFDNVKDAIINPKDMVLKVEGIPKVAIACFSKSLFEKILLGVKNKQIAKLSNTNGEKKIYQIEYCGIKAVLFMIGVGAPAAVSELEDIHAMGVEKFIVFGNCGVLDKNIDDCSVIIPNEAIRDEGTSYHYMLKSDTIKLNKKYVDDFKEILHDYGYSYTECMTWTTDAFYRETREKMKKMLLLGAKTVEMEASALQAVADFRGFDLFIYFHGGGLTNCSHKNYDPTGLAFEKINMAFASVEYRLYPNAKFPDFIEDAAKSVKWLKDNISNYGKCNRIFVGGSSAGGYLSMMLCFDKKYLNAVGLEPTDIDGYIHDAGQPTTHFNVLKEYGLDHRRIIVDEKSPMYFVGTE